VWKIAVCFLLLACVATGLFVNARLQARNDRFYTNSCANHSGQHGLSIRLAASDQPDFVFPATSDARTALLTIYQKGGFPPRDLDWITSYGAACPESFLRNGSIGYVYVRDDLAWRDVESNHIPILFCPAENHRRSSEHCHLLDGDRQCVDSNAEMIELLRSAIDRGESGEVSYSPRAMAALREELKKRSDE
jgi:hypothetical protein